MASFGIISNQENTNAAGRQPQKETHNQVQQQKRFVLGVISNNVKPLQRQNVLQKDESKKKSAVDAKREPFIIFEDKVCEREGSCENATQKESKPSVQDLPDTITALPRLPLQDISVLCNEESIFEESLEISPMVVDKSDVKTKDDGREKQNDMQDILGVEYQQEIYQYLKEVEVCHRPKPNYMMKQPDITYSMRSILIDWLVEVAEEYKLQTETLYLAVSYIDRFLSRMSVVRAKLQLVGTAAMFIAAKYEDMYPPDVGEFVYITDDTYTKKQVLRMEHLILKVLAFDLSSPTVLTFLNIYTLAMKDMRYTVKFLAMYVSELSLVMGDPYLKFLPSMRAASAVALARHTLCLEVWPQKLQEASGYHLDDLKSCIEHLHETFEGASTHPQQAVREKYKTNRWNNVSLLTPRSSAIC